MALSAGTQIGPYQIVDQIGEDLRSDNDISAAISALELAEAGSSAAGEVEDDERIAPRDGVEAFLVDSGRHAGALVLAAWWVLLFFGGGALPFVTGEEVAAVIAPHFGSGLATILTMMVLAGLS